MELCLKCQAVESSKEHGRKAYCLHVQLENTVWGQLGTSQADVDYAVLEDKFAAKQAVKQIGGKGPSGPQRPKQAMLLPLQRAQNVGVFLTRLKMGPAQVGSAPTSGCTFHMGNP